MKRPVESVHKMELRGSGQRRPASKESLSYVEQDTTTENRDRVQRLYPDLDTDTDKDEDPTEGTDADPCKVNRFVSSMGQSVPFLLTSILVVLLLFQAAFTECDKEKPAATSTKSLQDLSEQYPQHKSFWKAVNVSIRMCTMSTQPGVVLVLHNGDGSIAECLVNLTAGYLPRLVSVSESDQYWYVDGKNAHQIYDSNSFLKEILSKRKNLGVLVFNNLEDMDLELVKTLHFICDGDINISDKSVIILMLKVQAQIFRDSELIDLAHKKLAELWEEKLGNRFMPIIGRITNNLGYIDENLATKCP